MESVKHQIEYKRLDEIRPYDNNPRRNDEAAKAVANSIKEFGFQSPIIVDRDGVIIAGHTRYKAARRLKLQEVPVIVAAELDPEKVKALRIADNSTGEVAEWDLQLLVQELTGIEYDMTDFGLNLQIKIDEEVKEDDFTAEPPEQPITQRGDIWLLGDHRVMCGDSTSPQDVERLMDGQLADLLLTDPPYNVNYQGSNGKKIENDNMAESQFRQFLLQAYSRAFDACRTGASAYIFHADTEGEAFRAMFREAGWGLHGCLVWVKNSLVLGHSDYQWQHEPCLYGWKPGANHYFVNDRSQTTVIDDAKPADLRHMKKDQLLDWAIKAQALLTQKPSSVIRCDKPPRNAEHPTMKPVVLCGRLIKNSSLPGQTVLDLFREAGWGLHGCLVWVKNSLVLGHSDYQWQHEPCLYGWKPGANHYFVNDRSQTTVIDDAKPADLRHMKKDQLLDWAIKAQALLTQKPSSVIRCDKPPRNAEHPTMKPVVLCGRLIKNSSLPGQTVLDLFGGSGSTLIACEQLSRKCYTMEYDPRYVDVIVQRWEDFTGEKAVRLK